MISHSVFQKSFFVHLCFNSIYGLMKHSLINCEFQSYQKYLIRNLKMASALASLTANYTDSEGEEDRGSEGEEMHPSLAERLLTLKGEIGRKNSVFFQVRENGKRR